MDTNTSFTLELGKKENNNNNNNSLATPIHNNNNKIIKAPYINVAFLLNDLVWPGIGSSCYVNPNRKEKKESEVFPHNNKKLQSRLL